MGYEPPTTGTRLDFTGTAHEGLEVTVDEVPLGTTLSLTQQWDKVAAAQAAPEDPEAMLAALPAVAVLVEGFAAALESWNVTRKGQPVPATAEGLRSLGTTFAIEIIGAWMTGTVSAPPPLPGNSESGGTSPEELAAMAALSSSLPS
jgi:hypothetical protein